jgi:hypothetical protein
MIRDRGGRPGKSDPQARQDAAAALAVAALAYLAGDPEHLERFLALTGISPGDIRAAAREPDFAAPQDLRGAGQTLMYSIPPMEPHRAAKTRGSSPFRSIRPRKHVAQSWIARFIVLRY